jgi:hypothetical protein
MISGYFVELTLGWIEFFLILCAHHLMIKVKEPFDVWHLLNLESWQTQKELVKGL